MRFRTPVLFSLLACVIVTHSIAIAIVFYITPNTKALPKKEFLIFENRTGLEQAIDSNDTQALSSILNSRSAPTIEKVRIAIDANGNFIGSSLQQVLSPAPTTSPSPISVMHDWLNSHLPFMKSQTVADSIQTSKSHHNTLLLFLASFSLLTLLSLWLSKHLSKPLKLLDKIAKSPHNNPLSALPTSVYRYTETRTIATHLTSLRSTIKKQESSLFYQSQYDDLTGLPNYQSALETLDTEVHKDNPFNIIHITLHELRSINGTFGYTTGDQVLKESADRLRHLASAGHRPFRLYNNEFLFLSEGEEVDSNWLNLLIDALSAPIVLQGKASIKPDFSIGKASHPSDGNSAQVLLRRTDIALYDAHKKAITYAPYTPELERLNTRKTIIINDLQSSIRNQELWLDYQPKVETQSGGVKHFEALMRWNHPTLGFIFPDEFIGIAEQTGSIGLLSGWLMTHVCQQLHMWKQSGNLLCVAINLSANDISDPDLPQRIHRLLTDYELAPWQLSIEITESAAMEDMVQAIEVLKQLSLLGITLAIDDFGTGYASLSQLKQLPVDELKIDKSFVLRLHTEEHNLAIVRSTIELGHILSLKVVAEGVENIESANALIDLGCDFLQGYWIAKPMPAHQVIGWLQKFKPLALQAHNRPQ